MGRGKGEGKRERKGERMREKLKKKKKKRKEDKEGNLKKEKNKYVSDIPHKVQCCHRSTNTVQLLPASATV